MATQVHALHRGGRKYSLNDYTSLVPSPQIVGFSAIALSAQFYSLPIPAPAKAGHLAVIFGGHGYNWISIPAGWTIHNETNVSNWNGCIFSKILDATDISTGHVSVASNGVYDGCLIMVVCSFTTSVKQFGISNNTNNTPTLSGPSLGGLISTQLALIFGSDRANNTPTSDTGTYLTLVSDSRAAVGVIYTLAPQGSIINPTFTYPGGNLGAYQAVVIV